MDDLECRERAKQLIDALISGDKATIEAARTACSPDRAVLAKVIEDLANRARATVGNDNG